MSSGLRDRGGREGVALHRPERSWPLPPPIGPIALAAAPGLPEPERGGLLTSVLPLVGSLGIVAFAFVVRSVVYLVVAGFMVTAMVGGTLGARAVQRRSERGRRTRARAGYERHLRDVAGRADAAAVVQLDGLLGLYPDTVGLLAHAAAGIVWERRRHHPDFGHVRLGLGRVPAGSPVTSAEGSGPLAAREADLAAAADELVTGSAALPDAPVVIPLRDLSSVALVGPRPVARELAGSWLASLAATCSSTDLRVLVHLPEQAKETSGVLEPAGVWEWLKWLPHLRDVLAGEGFGRATRAVTHDAGILLGWLDQLVGDREEQERRTSESAGGWRPTGTSIVVGEHVLVLLDGYDPDGPLGQAHAVDTLLARGAALAVTVLVLVDTPEQVPSTCGATVLLTPDGTATYREAGPAGRLEHPVRADRVDLVAAEELARLLAPLRVAGADAGADTVTTVRLVELLGLDDPAELDPTGQLAADTDPLEPGLLATPIGVRADGSPIVLDLKESAAGGLGPHGVLVGATGSGKSELLRSLVAGLAARHCPDLLSFVLVDFKGGAAFADFAALPHTAGLITNLADDLTLVDRMRQALEGELDRRQQLLSDAGVDSIGELHRARTAGAAVPALAYLVVIVDEFGELLAARPEMLDVLVGIGRLGRSLGVHLLLGTQRLEEGRIRGLETHLRYRLVLRTFSPAESQAVLGSADAYALPPLPGLGYLRVDATVTRFKAALMSLPHRPRRAGGLLSELAQASPFRLIDPDAATAPGAPPAVLGAAGGSAGLGAGVVAAPRTELQVLLGRLSTTPVDRDPIQPAGSVSLLDRPNQALMAQVARPVWLPPLPDTICLAELLGADASGGGDGADLPGVVTVGLVDEPRRQRQVPLRLDLTGAGGHVAIVGGPRTGRTTFLRTFALSLLGAYRPTGPRSPAEVQLLVLDLGGGLHDLAELPHVAVVTGRYDPEGMTRLLRELRAVVDERAAALRDAGRPAWPGRDGQALLPDPLAAELYVLIDNLGVLRSEFTELDLELADLAVTALQFGVHVVLTAGRWLDIRPALLDAIGTRLELRLNDPVDSLVGRGAAAAIPVGRPGRVLLRDGRIGQLARPAPDHSQPTEAATAAEPTEQDRKQPNDSVGQLATRTSVRYPQLRAPRVAPLPLRLTVQEVPHLAAGAFREPRSGSERVVTDGGLLLGLEEFRLTPVTLDLLAPGASLLVFGDGGTGRTALLRRAVTTLAAAAPGRVQLHVVDLGRGLLDLADLGAVASYAFTASMVEQLATALVKELFERLPPPDLPRLQLRDRSWWSGPEHVLVVDDYDLTLSGGSGPLGVLTDPLAQARDLGLHVLLARRVAGSARTGFEPFGQRLREVTTSALLLSGDRSEGPLLGERTATRRPAGRGLLVRRGHRDTVIQLAVAGEDR